MMNTPWSQKDLDIIKINMHLPVKQVMYALRSADCKRTQASIESMLRKLRAETRVGDIERDTFAPIDLPEHEKDLHMHLVLESMPATFITQQRYHHNVHPLSLKLTRTQPDDPFDQCWSSDLLPGARFARYALIRACLV